MSVGFTFDSVGENLRKGLFPAQISAQEDLME